MTTDEMIAALETLPGCTNWQMQADCDQEPSVKHDHEYSVAAWFSGTVHTGVTHDSLEGAFQELLKVIEADLAPQRGLLAALDELSGVSTVRLQTSE